MLTAPRQEIGPAASRRIILDFGFWIQEYKRLKQNIFQNRNLCYDMFKAAKFGRRCRSGSGERTAGMRLRCFDRNPEGELRPERIFLFGFAVTH